MASPFRLYLRKCEREKAQAVVARNTGGTWCPVTEVKTQFSPAGKDTSKVKVFDKSINKSVWVRISILEESWSWPDAK